MWREPLGAAAYVVKGLTLLLEVLINVHFY